MTPVHTDPPPAPAAAEPHFLELGAFDRRRSWTYLAGSGLVFGVTALLVVPIIGLLLLISGRMDHGGGSDALGSPGNALQLLGIFSPHLIGLPILMLVVHRLHRRPVHTLWSPTPGIDWPLLLRAFALSLGVILAWALLDLSLDDGTALHWSFDPLRWILGLLLFGPLWLVQVSAEELLFRGYLSQGLMRVLRRPVPVALIVAGLFVPLHYSPEYPWWVYAELVLTSLMLSLLAWRANRLEAAIGLHLANNLFLFAGIGNASTGISDQPVARILEQDFGSPAGLLVSAIQYAVIYALLFGRGRAGLWQRGSTEAVS